MLIFFQFDCKAFDAEENPTSGAELLDIANVVKRANSNKELMKLDVEFSKGVKTQFSHSFNNFRCIKNKLNLF